MIARASASRFVRMIGVFVAAWILVSETSRAMAQPASTDWQDYIAGPTTRLNEPQGISFAHNNSGSITGGSNALVEDAQVATITRTGGTSPQLAIDFGLPVSGKVEVVFGNTVTAPLNLAFSQRLEYLNIGSDTDAYYLGDLNVTGRPGVTWRTDNRRGFRYMLLYLPQTGTVQIDAVRVYHTPYLGHAGTYDGHFLCDDDLFNRIWYGCVYTVEISTTSGNDIDGPWEIEEGMLSVSYEGDDFIPGGPFGFTVPGSGWTDYALDFDFKIMPLGKTCGWAFRAQDGGNTYMWQIVSDEGGANANTLRKHVRQGGNWSSITSVNLPGPVSEGELHHVRTEVEGSTIRTYLDAQLIDTTDNATFDQGRIGFYSDEANREHFHVDNVTVTDSGGTLFSDDFEGEFLVADWDDWERAELNTINDGAKRDRVWVWGDFYPAQRAMWVAHWEPEIILETMRDGVANQYDQSVEDTWGPVLRGKMPAANATGNHYMTDSGFAAKWLDDYTFWWVLTLHHHWMRTGDLAVVNEMYPALLGVLDDWCVRKMRSDGLIQLQLGDWYWSFLRIGAGTAFNALYVQSLRCGAEMAEALGNPGDAANWTGRADAVVAAMNTHLYDNGQQLYYDSVEDQAHYPLDANTLTILYGIADGAKTGPMLDQIETRMWSPVGTKTAWPDYDTWGHDDQVWAWYVQYEVEARFQLNDDDRAMEAIRRPWQTMVDGDPGRTMWEFIMADGGVENGLRNTDHAFSAGAAWLMSEYVAGVLPTSPGFTTFDIIPHPGHLTWVQCRVPTPAGAISIEYNLDRDEKTYQADFEVPPGTTGRVAVPRLGLAAVVTLDDQAVWTPGGPVGDATSDDHHLYFPDVGPGVHILDAQFDPGVVDPDFDFDLDVDLSDFGRLQACLTGNGNPPQGPECAVTDLDDDNDVDQVDIDLFLGCVSGSGVLPDANCDDGF